MLSSTHNKYSAKKTLVDGVEFASRAEARRYRELLAMLRLGEISDLELQPRYKVIPAQRRHDGTRERAAYYVADFRYVVRAHGRTVVEDVKSLATRTPAYILKRKLMLLVHGVSVMEVMA